MEKACADQMAKFVSACQQAQHKLAESLHKNVRIFSVCGFDKWMSGLLLVLLFDFPPSTPCIYSETWNLRDSPEREFLGKRSLILDVYN